MTHIDMFKPWSEDDLIELSQAIGQVGDQIPHPGVLRRGVNDKLAKDILSLLYLSKKLADTLIQKGHAGLDISLDISSEDDTLEEGGNRITV